MVNKREGERPDQTRLGGVGVGGVNSTSTSTSTSTAAKKRGCFSVPPPVPLWPAVTKKKKTWTRCIYHLVVLGT